LLTPGNFTPYETFLPKWKPLKDPNFLEVIFLFPIFLWNLTIGSWVKVYIPDWWGIPLYIWSFVILIDIFYLETEIAYDIKFS
jgi:hypothetical protein